jgi:hypothetical protein
MFEQGLTSFEPDPQPEKRFVIARNLFDDFDALA